ncbi:MAG: hypothetical protein JJT82_09240 [Legionellaceae bacterium]|nr:hypothetical protein [Legionellaceae bacterium]
MTNELIEKQIDLYQYPTEFEPSLGSVTIGDLHGNTLKLLHFLLRHRIIQFKNDYDPKQSYEDFVEIYESIGESTTAIDEKQDTIRYQEKRIGGYQSRIKELTDKPESILRIENFKKASESAISAAQSDLLPLKQPLAELVRRFNEFMTKLEVNHTSTLVRLIGDELADRGSNDYFTLRCLGFLKEHGVPVNILISNHSNEFVTAYESLAQGQGFTPENEVNDKQKPSFIGLKILLDEQIVSDAQVTQLVDVAYKPALKVMDYTLSEDGITLFSHAPVSFALIQHIAAHLGVVYHDTSKEALATTIDKINSQFSQIVHDNRVHEFCNCNDKHIVLTNMTPSQVCTHPLVHVMWNRWTAEKDSEDTRPASKNGYHIAYIHGHDDYLSPLPHVFNLDTACGKGTRKSIEQKMKVAEAAMQSHAPDREYARKFLNDVHRYKIWNSDEQGLYQKHEPARIDREFQQSRSISSEKRAEYLASMAAGTGLVLGIILGIVLVLTGLFAPFGAGVFGALALALTLGGGMGLAASALGLTVATATESTPVMDTVIAHSKTQESNNRLSKLGFRSTENGSSVSGASPLPASTSELEPGSTPEKVESLSGEAQKAEQKPSVTGSSPFNR